METRVRGRSLELISGSSRESATVVTGDGFMPDFDFESDFIALLVARESCPSLVRDLALEWDLMGAGVFAFLVISFLPKRGLQNTQTPLQLPR